MSRSPGIDHRRSNLLASSRRGFIQRLAIAPAVLAAMSRGLAAERSAAAHQVRFGLIADVHHDLVPDGLDRLRAFVSAMKKARPDFIVQLGDFCWPTPRNQHFLDAWNEFPGPRFHALGNHDMDGGFAREQAVGFFGMPAKHYAFAAGPARCLVLDGNEPGGKAAGYKRFVGVEQIAWLEGELAQSGRPAVVFIHQPFDGDNTGCLENSAAVRDVIARAERSRPGSVIAVFSGHRHLDYALVVNGVPHIQINSASYWWLNNPAARGETYPPEVHRAYPYLSHVAAYRDPLWALVSLDFERGELSVEGRRTEWVGPDPWTRGEETSSSREQLHPWISDRRLKLADGIQKEG